MCYRCQVEITRSHYNCSPILPTTVLRNRCAYNYLPTGTLDGMEWYRVASALYILVYIRSAWLVAVFFARRGWFFRI